MEAGRATLKRALALRDEAVPSDHPDTGLSRQNLGALELDAGNYDRAGELLTAAWERRSIVVGETHPEMLELMQGRAAAAAGARRLDEAERLYARALALHEEAGDLDSEGARTVGRSYAALLDQRGKGEEARALERRFASAAR